MINFSVIGDPSYHKCSLKRSACTCDKTFGSQVTANILKSTMPKFLTAFGDYFVPDGTIDSKA